MIQGLPESGYTRVYRKIVEQLRTDPVLESLGVEWMPWDGSSKHVRPTVLRRPRVEMIPTLSGQGWISPDAFRGDMAIVVRTLVPNTFDACDCLDLWAAIEHAIYPVGDRAQQKAFEKRLRGDGCGGGGPCDAETGEVRFVQPASIQPQFNGDAFACFECVGSMSISILRSINP